MPIHILDSNIILSDARSIHSFPGEDVVIYIGVLEEIDRKKTLMTSVGAAARAFNRELASMENLYIGEKLEHGGTLRVTFDTCKVTGLEDTVDNRILGAALHLKNQGKSVILVTNDSNLICKSQAIGIKSKRYDGVERDDEAYSGVSEFAVDESLITEFNSGGSLPMHEFGLSPNEFCILRSNEDNDKYTFGRFDGKTDTLKPLKFTGKAFGLSPRNIEQRFALDLLMDPEVKLVSLIGLPGGGKTLLALAAGLACVTETSRYKKLLIAKPIVSLGNEIGFLPGSAQEKVEPYLGSITCNLEVLLSSHTKEKGRQTKSVTYQDLIDQDVLGIEILSYIRGKSLHNMYVIVDEAQQLSQHEIKSIITRAGQGCKIVLTGDPQQIDTKQLDACNNAVSIVADKFKSYTIAGHVTLIKGERSELATLASEVL